MNFNFYYYLTVYKLTLKYFQIILTRIKFYSLNHYLIDFYYSFQKISYFICFFAENSFNCSIFKIFFLIQNRHFLHLLKFLTFVLFNLMIFQIKKFMIFTIFLSLISMNMTQIFSNFMINLLELTFMNNFPADLISNYHTR